MAKKTAELTPKQKVLSDARVKLDNAEKADAAKSTDATKKAVADATSVFNAANADVKRENFVRVAGGRVKKARIAIRNLGNISNLRTYQYSQSDVDTAEKAILEMLANAKAKMVDGLRTKTASATPKDDFTF